MRCVQYHLNYNDFAGGFIHLRDGANTQYATAISFLLSVYGDLLAKHNQKVPCGSKELESNQLHAFAKQQVTSNSTSTTLLASKTT